MENIINSEIVDETFREEVFSLFLCPFCGGVPSLCFNHTEDNVLIRSNGYFIKCKNCGASSETEWIACSYTGKIREKKEKEAMEEVIRLWNQRRKI